MEKNYYSENSNNQLFTIFDSVKYRKTNSYRNHRHTQIELGYIVHGKGEYIIEQNSFDILQGDLFLVRPNEQHCVPTIVDDELVSFNIHISPLYLWRVLSDYVEVGKLNCLVCSDIDIPTRIRGNKSVLEIIDKLRFSFQNDDRFAVRRLIIELFVQLCKDFPSTLSNDKHEMRTEDVRSSVYFIEKNISLPITLDDIAKAGNMSRSHINEWFHRVVGMTPYEYLLVRRIEYAVELLRSSNITVLAISEACGFSNLSNFNKAFKKRTGITPQEYRRKAQKTIRN